MKVSSQMTKEIIFVGPETSMVEAAHLMADNHCRHLPVIEGRELVGLLSDRDIQRALQVAMVDPDTEEPVAFGLEHSLLVKNFMSSPVQTLSSDAELVEAVDLMVNNKIGALVIQGAKEVEGILTETDLMKVLKDILSHASQREGFHIDQLKLKLGIGKVADLLSQLGI